MMILDCNDNSSILNSIGKNKNTEFFNSAAKPNNKKEKNVYQIPEISLEYPEILKTFDS